MGSSQKDIELSPVKPLPNTSAASDKLSVPADEEDVIIGRFRKISSAKSMAATNGNIQYPDLPLRHEDAEAGLQFKLKEAGEKEKLLSEFVTNGAVVIQPESSVTKSSFRDSTETRDCPDNPP
ncbi:Uncharacterized protein OBRU01_20520 [Operophtera brumata]|uniref:Uncharacterized protein n=1 Tax=Operophtera brumata TaxID=104452 RepID=A0A0L7KUL5_OPEBR|nr:Uncharacterized protein OBRU01_20520 [Operophtera brumata]